MSALAPTPVFEGMKAHRNRMRRHGAVCKTPAEVAGTSTECSNKWKATMYRIQAPI